MIQRNSIGAILVTLTATTEATDDVVVLLWRGLRFRFANNGDHTYTGRWKAPLMRGVGHVGVNALSHGTLFDDLARYDSQPLGGSQSNRKPANPQAAANRFRYSGGDLFPR